MKNQRLGHRKRRTRPLTRLQPITNNNKQPSQQLASRPTNRTRRLRTHRPCYFDKPFQRHGHEAETRCAEDSEDDEGSDERAGTGRPDKSEVGSCDDGDEDSYEGQVGFCAVDDGGGDCCRNEADENENGACDAGFGFGEGIRGEDLGEEGGEAVEEANVDGEGEENEVEGWVFGEEGEGLPDRWRGMGGGGGDGGWRFGRDEEGGNSGDGGDEGDVEGHGGDLRGAGCQEGVYELPESAAERVCEGGDCGGGDAAGGGEPDV